MIFKSALFRFTIASLLLAFFLSSYYADSFFVRRYLIPASSSSAGVVFHDRLRFDPKGTYVVVDNYMSQNQCDVMTWAGQFVKRFPGSYCSFLDDGSFLYYTGRVEFFLPDGTSAWKRKLHLHHDLFVDQKNREILVVSDDSTDSGGRKLRWDRIRILNFLGEEVFSWGVAENRKKLEFLLGVPLELEHKPELKNWQWTHWNSVQPLPPNSLEAQDTRFRRGNILVNCFKTKMMFIIDRETRNIVWHFNVPGHNGAHHARMNSVGLISYFNNVLGVKGSKNLHSAVEILDPRSQQVLVSQTTTPSTDFFSPYGGSLEPLGPGDVYLVTNSLGANAFVFQVGTEARILWQWLAPADSRGAREKVYRLTPASQKNVENVLRFSQSLSI